MLVVFFILKPNLRRDCEVESCDHHLMLKDKWNLVSVLNQIKVILVNVII